MMNIWFDVYLILINNNDGDVMKYTVEITETLIKTVEVEASNKDEAITKVKDDYYKEIIILNPEECDINVDFKGIL